MRKTGFFFILQPNVVIFKKFITLHRNKSKALSSLHISILVHTGIPHEIEHSALCCSPVIPPGNIEIN